MRFFGLIAITSAFVAVANALPTNEEKNVAVQGQMSTKNMIFHPNHSTRSERRKKRLQNHKRATKDCCGNGNLAFGLGGRLDISAGGPEPAAVAAVPPPVAAPPPAAVAPPPVAAPPPAVAPPADTSGRGGDSVIVVVDAKHS